jgi:hypothetical protein
MIEYLIVVSRARSTYAEHGAFSTIPFQRNEASVLVSIEL